MQVLKFGGSSVANDINIQRVTDIVQKAAAKDQTIIVVSALGGITDMLLQSGTLAAANDPEYRHVVQQIRQRHLQTVESLLPVRDHHLLRTVLACCSQIEEICNGIFLLKEFSDRTRDRIASYGELLSSQILSAYLQAKGTDNEWVDARQLIVTNEQYTKAAVDFERTNATIASYFEGTTARLFVVPGFIGATPAGETTTLGRGGSDYTAAIIGAAQNAEPVEIWTDVSGMMTADPRLVQNAKPIAAISFQEAMELSHFGAKVLYPPTIQPLMQKNLPVWIKNTFAPDDEGTLITAASQVNDSIIRGISSMNKIALVSLEGSGMIGIPGFSRRLFEALASRSVNVILITQASSEHSICVGIEDANVGTAKAVVDHEFRNEIREGRVNPLEAEPGLAIVALVGDHMKNHTGISGKLFSALGRNGVNVRAIAQGSSERNISTVIAEKDVRKAINVLHEEFFEATYKQVNLFVVGVGNVGGKLLNQLGQQQQWLQEHLRLQLRVVGIASSKKMVFDDKGINLQRWAEVLQEGSSMSLEGFTQAILQKNLRNSVFVDVTASEAVARCYEPLFQKSVSVVACNKIATSAPFDRYRQLKHLSREYNAQFLFETNVGAGLPVINTLNDLMSSGDRIQSIEAVLSGTLNFVFNHYDGSRPFASVVRQAQDEGYTEPDPRLDLSGTDVMRKILILAREAGEEMEMQDISNTPFLPPSCMEGSVEDFYKELEKHEAHFRQLYTNAKSAGKKLKYVARYADGAASVGLQQIDAQHDFFHLYGKDNVVRFYTNRYAEQPLVVKGAGAGAEVTASGVFADIIKTARI